ncbi:MAG: STAS domain-containing protein [Motiliproteus sp.]
MEAKLVSAEGGWCVEGDINYKTVVSLRDQGEKNLEQVEESCFFDFSAVNSVNTSALSLLLCWYRKAKKLGVKLDFVALPPNLIAIAEMSDLSSVIESSSGPL